MKAINQTKINLSMASTLLDSDADISYLIEAPTNHKENASCPFEDAGRLFFGRNAPEEIKETQPRVVGVSKKKGPLCL